MSTSSPNEAISSRLSRDQASGFNIRQECFICSKSWKKGDKLTLIVTGTGENTRQKVLSAAIARKDDLLFHRMIAHPELFAFDEKYHRSCYAHFISERNIQAAQSKQRDSIESTLDTDFQILVSDIQQTILSKQKTVATLSQIKANYEEKLLESGRHVYSWKLKEKLNQHFQGEIVFIERRGLSDIVCSSEVTVGDALRKASELHENIQEDEMYTYGLSVPVVPVSPETDEKRIMYTAAKNFEAHHVQRERH